VHLACCNAAILYKHSGSVGMIDFFTDLPWEEGRKIVLAKYKVPESIRRDRRHHNKAVGNSGSPWSYSNSQAAYHRVLGRRSLAADAEK
jgi:hypothetical protein